jgi:protein-tyrosine phosphatase
LSLLRAALDRLLHLWRRRQALARLRRHRMPRGVLFVCHGNICRSPYAAGVFRARLGAVANNLIGVRSAGFVGNDRTAPRFAVEEAAARGIDLREHRSMTVSAGELRQAELVVVMEPVQAHVLRERYPTAGTILVLGDLDPLSERDRVIVDPVERPRAVFAASYDRIDRCVAVLAEAVAG